MLMPIMTPSQTAVTFAPGSASRMGATIGTTTTEISIKSRKKPRMKMTAITVKNWPQKPPGRLVRKFLTRSSPPKPRKAAVSMVAPMRMTKTSAVVLAVSTMTPCRVLPIDSTRQPLQNSAVRSAATAIEAIHNQKTSSLVTIFLTLMGWVLATKIITTTEMKASRAGQ